MCRKLSERAAEDLIAFVREVYRNKWRQDDPHHSAAARKVLDKHGLLTLADDPEAAAVFMEDAETPIALHANNPPSPDPDFASCDVPGCNFLAEGRFGYCCSPEHEAEMGASGRVPATLPQGTRCVLIHDLGRDPFGENPGVPSGTEGVAMHGSVFSTPEMFGNR